MEVRIILTPPGEAPEEIRAAWVGLILPLSVPGMREVHGWGVLSGPKSKLGEFFFQLFGRAKRERRYMVEAARAVEILATHSPDAARWWRENAPAAIRSGQQFLFSTEVCEEIAA